MSKEVIVIGSGFSSLSAACYLARRGYRVAIYEKNGTIGGRARQLKKKGFVFDMGPTWYWMPDVFTTFFADFNRKPSDYYQLQKLDPAYSIYFGKNDCIAIPDTLEKIIDLFEKEEPGSGERLKTFIAKAKDNYNLVMKDLVYNTWDTLLGLFSGKALKKMHYFFNTIKKEVRKEFKNKRLIQILEFPALFLGAKPSNTPAFYNFMNFADFGLGTWYPQNGMYSVIEGLKNLALELGVKIYTYCPVEKILVKNKKVTGVMANNERIKAAIIVSGADYYHSETLLDEKYRSYKESYWNRKTFAPSSLLFYIGFDKKIENVTHHTLFFDEDFDAHARAIYTHPSWPEEPLFYASFPSKTDESAAPQGCEAGIFLIPIAADIEDTPKIREYYFNIIMERFERITAQQVKNNIIFNHSFCVNDFVNDYHSYKGNAYGMANTLLQTAFFRPRLKSQKVKNLYFTGQLTLPGPGVPPSLISGKLAADLVKKYDRPSLFSL